MWNIRYQTIESCVWKTSVKFFTCYLDESRLRWWVTTIPMNRVPIPQNDNTNPERIWKLATHFEYTPYIVFNRTYERIKRHNPTINGSSIDNIAEGVQGLCGKVNYSPLGKKQPHNLPTSCQPIHFLITLRLLETQTTKIILDFIVRLVIFEAYYVVGLDVLAKLIRLKKLMISFIILDYLQMSLTSAIFIKHSLE